MDVQVNDEYVVVTKEINDCSWTIFVIDDAWQKATEIFQAALKSEFDENSADKIRKSRWHVHEKGLALIGVFFHELDIKRLLIGDFPRSTDVDTVSWIEKEWKCLDNTSKMTTAFLIDINDADNEPIGLEVEKALKDLQVPDWSMAFLTVGGDAGESNLEIIVKHHIIDKKYGKNRLKEWFNNIEGDYRTINYYFSEFYSAPKYTMLTSKIPHEPEHLYQIRENLHKLAELRIFDKLARQDKNNVWRWAQSVLLDEYFTMENKVYAYFCAKVFMNDTIKKEFSYYALRGLAFGLGISSNIDTVEDIDSTPCDENTCKELIKKHKQKSKKIKYHTESKTPLFLIAQKLRDFIHAFADDDHPARIIWIHLNLSGKKASIIFELNRPLCIECFAEKTGSMSIHYRELKPFMENILQNGELSEFIIPFYKLETG